MLRTDSDYSLQDSMPRPKPSKTIPLVRLREICLALPSAYEQVAWGSPTFRVRGGKMFAMSHDNHHGDRRVAIWCKSTFNDQDLMVRSDPKRFFIPPYVGPSGWVGVRLDLRPNWETILEVIEAAYRLAAPKRLLAGLRRS
ncbi:MAG: MmcQ/YjbR family DNA-binding protein [Gemmatimonadota bacterium]